MSEQSEELNKLQQQVEIAQAQLEKTLDEIQHRLNPNQLLDRAINMITNETSNTSSAVGNMIRNHPIPVAMVGIGLGWLLLSSNEKQLSQVQAWAGEAVDRTRESLKNTVDTVTETASELKDKAVSTVQNITGSGEGENLEGWAQQATEQARQKWEAARRSTTEANRALWDAVEEHPFATGLMAVAVGAAIGASLPQSQTENRLITGLNL